VSVAVAGRCLDEGPPDQERRLVRGGPDDVRALALMKGRRLIGGDNCGSSRITRPARPSLDEGPPVQGRRRQVTYGRLGERLTSMKGRPIKGGDPSGVGEYL
jgi:hypothetical protein